jgi:hypothetical protein
MEAKYKYHIEEIMGSVKKKGKINYLENWRGLLAKKDWSWELFSSFYSVWANKELRKFQSKNPEAPRDLTFKTNMSVFLMRFLYVRMYG